MSNRIRVSVVVPVYNAEPYLPAFLKSFATQTLSADDVELVVVNDGSTDGSGAILEDFSRQCSNVSVIHQENSGWAGSPRNVGMNAARGTYVFFADSDDKFGGPEALERLVDFADEYQCDVVVPRMVPKGQRVYPQWRYKTTQVDADLVTCFTTLTPQKLFRRSFMNRENIRFPEGKVRLEDGQLLSRAYLLASRVSILTGYEFYHLIHHNDGKHLSSTPKDPANYIGSVSVMSENVEKYCADEDTGDRIINEIYYRKVLNNFAKSKLVNYSEKKLEKWLVNQQRFVDRFINDRRYSKMGEVSKKRTDLVRAGDMGAIVEYSRAGSVDFTFSNAQSNRGSLTLVGELTGPTDTICLPSLVIEQRGEESIASRLPFAREGRGVSVTIPKTVLPAQNTTQRYDLFLSPGNEHPKKRTRGPKRPFVVEFLDERRLLLYSTKQGNLSIEIKKGLSVGQRAKRRVKRMLRR
ncbi:glycosyltransferase family 2 protein [Brevibacterium aurantiacum]|uniref:Uncharacterized protein n=1 Tax=Brevibacterium aurantiacum TaxID=273384 RepID=A0A2A3ZRA4_BREAU|nr:glycosyltransferase [Brevibacterium aurantiacum]PCC54068.1 hypothetical protein CIK59_09930 [Brevibacterium aurantiacum]